MLGREVEDDRHNACVFASGWAITQQFEVYVDIVVRFCVAIHWDDTLMLPSSGGKCACPPGPWRVFRWTCENLGSLELGGGAVPVVAHRWFQLSLLHLLVALLRCFFFFSFFFLFV